MKRITPFFIVTLIAFLIAACGGATPVATQPPAEPTATEAPTQAATEEAATEAPGATEALAGAGNQVDITLADNTIDASLTTFEIGVPYTFVITNTGEHPHNFNINTPVSVTGSLEGAFESALLAVPQEQLGSGQSVTVDFTFPAESAGQLLEFSCLIRRHYEDGMLLPITVAD